MRIFGWLEIDAGRSEPRPYKRLEDGEKAAFKSKALRSEWLLPEGELDIEVALCRKS